MNTKDFIRLGIPLGEATRRATDFISKFILAGGNKTRLEEEVKAIIANPSAFTEDSLRGELAKALLKAPPPPRTELTHSEVTRHRGSKGGTTYAVDIHYRYVVNDRSFEGTVFRYNAQASSDSGWAVKAVAAHPVGSPTQVFCNPQNPQDALLSPGLNGSDLMLVLFLMPFNMVTLGLLTWLGGWLRERIFKPVAGGVRIITEGPLTRIRLPEYAAMVWCMVAVGGLSFASTFVLLIPSGFHPSLSAASSTLLVVAAAGVVAYVWQWQKIHSGEDDLILDEGAQTIALPETYGRTHRVTLAVSDIENFTLEVIEHRSRKGGVSYTYAPTLWLRDGVEGEAVQHLSASPGLLPDV